MFFKKKEPRSIDEILTPKEEKKDTYEDMADVEIPNYKEQKKDEARHESEGEGLNALSCFGWREENTEKWLGKCVKFWFCLMSFLWFLFGALTFAPVIFISNKVNVIFNDKKKSLRCATLIHGLLLALVIFLVLIK